jgi:hypothetical protein
MADVNWWKIKDQSLARAAREAGFDLAVYEDYSEATRTELKSRAIKISMENIRQDFLELTDRELDSVKQGVYVICLSLPFTVTYPGGNSEIIYIGRGSINSRLKMHYERSLFRLMRSLAGTNFDFYLTEPKHHTSDGYFKHIEYLLLERFKNSTGDGRYPILNKNAGSDQGAATVGKGWDKPLKQSGKNRSGRWRLRSSGTLRH